MPARADILGPDHIQFSDVLLELGWAVRRHRRIRECETTREKSRDSRAFAGPRAQDFFERALAMREKAGNPADIAEALRGLGSVLHKRQRFKEADVLFQRALEAQQKAQS